MSDESINVKYGDLVVFRDGNELLAHGDYSLINVAAVYEPSDMTSESDLFRRWEMETGRVLDFSTWLRWQVADKRVKIFDQKYQAASSLGEEVINIGRKKDISDTSIIMLGGKKYELTEVEE